MSKKHMVAVYGSLRKGFGNHHFLENQEFVGDTVTQPEYKMFNLGAFPAVCRGGDTPITLEVYNVDAHCFERLDILEGHPDFYTRKPIMTEFGKAWMYFIDSMCDDRSTQRVASGDWSKRDEDERLF